MCYKNQPLHWAPIPVVGEPREKIYCTATTIPQRVCNEIAIQKSQGMTVEPGKYFQKVIILLPEAAHNETLGLEFIGISRRMNI